MAPKLLTIDVQPQNQGTGNCRNKGQPHKNYEQLYNPLHFRSLWLALRTLDENSA